MASRPPGKEAAKTEGTSPVAVEGGGAEGELQPGSSVRIDGIQSRPEINGQVGTVVTYLAERERYKVRLGDGEEIALKSNALTLQ